MAARLLISNLGFTVLELLVVSAIIAILSSVGIVEFTRTRDRQEVNLAAENFAQFLRATENMTRAGVPFPAGTGFSGEVDCDPSPTVERKSTTACGGYGVFVTRTSSEGYAYYRFADIANVSDHTWNSGDLRESGIDGEVSLPSTITMTATVCNSTSCAASASSAFSHAVVFVPPKDSICVSDGIGARCGPGDLREVTYTFSHATRSSIEKSVRINTVSGLVSVE